MGALVHIGLSALLVIAPALCCCNVRLLARQLAPAQPSGGNCPICPEPQPAVPPCCQSAKPVAKKSCCHDLESKPSGSQNQPEPAKPKPDRCDFCFGEKPNATPPKTLAANERPEPTGELIPIALLALAVLPSVHLGLQGGLDPPEGAGVDARWESLFTRHVLRC